MPNPAPIRSESPVLRNWLYQFRDGFLFAGQGMTTRQTARHPVALLLTTAEDGFVLSTGRQRVSAQAAVVGSLVARQLEAEGVPLVSINVQPEHPMFSSLHKAVGQGIRALNRAAFSHLDTDFHRAVSTELSMSDVRSVFDSLVAVLLDQLSIPPSERDDLADRLRLLVQENPDITLTELAMQLNLSYSRASRLFADTVGLPMRSYRLWRKAARAWAAMSSSHSLTDIALTAGFSDSSHFSRQWQQWFGVPPSDVRQRRVVRVRW